MGGRVRARGCTMMIDRKWESIRGFYEDDLLVILALSTAAAAQSALDTHPTPPSKLIHNHGHHEQWPHYADSVLNPSGSSCLSGVFRELPEPV